jgi:hypothetical protein
MPTTLKPAEIIEECWANWMRQDPGGAIETQADKSRAAERALHGCGEKDQSNLL